MSPFKSILRYFSIYRKYIGRRLYIVFALTLLAATTEGLGIALLLPLLTLLGVSQESSQAAEPLSSVATDGRSRLEGMVYDVVATLGIEHSMAAILTFISVVFLLKGVLKFAEGAYKSHLQAHLMRGMKARLFDAYAEMDYRYYTHYSAGHFVNLIVVQIPKFVKSFESYKKSLAAVITVTTYFAFAFLISWPFATMATLAGAAMLLVFQRLTRYVQDLSRKSATEYGTLNQFLVQTMHAFKYLSATAQIDPLRAAVAKSIRRLSGYYRKTEIAWSLTEASQEPLAVAVLVIIIVVQVTLLGQPVAPVLVGLVLIHRAMGQLVAVQGNWQLMMQDVGSLEAVEDEFARVAGHQQLTGTTVLAPLSRGIRLDRVSFAYDVAAGNVLDAISLSIPANRTIAVVGGSGAGKSTLVDLLTLILRPQHGELSIDGVPHLDVDVSSWRKQIGYVSQDTVVFDDSVANNICLWRGDYATDANVQTRVRQAAAQAGILSFIDELPNGFETRVGDRGIRLSGGQRQRLFIARELYKKPRLLILDEATSALDSESESVIKESVDQLKGSTTVVIIAHRLSTIRNADYIYVLDRGSIVEQGTYADLVAARDGAFNRMVALQQL